MEQEVEVAETQSTWIFRKWTVVTMEALAASWSKVQKPSRHNCIVILVETKPRANSKPHHLPFACYASSRQHASALQHDTKDAQMAWKCLKHMSFRLFH